MRNLRMGRTKVTADRVSRIPAQTTRMIHGKRRASSKRDTCRRLHLASKPGKHRNEPTFSGLPRIADFRRPRLRAIDPALAPRLISLHTPRLRIGEVDVTPKP